MEKITKNIACLLMMICFWSCRQGYWTNNNVYRAKRDNYSLNKLPFIHSDKITTNRFYLSEIYIVANKSDPKILSSAIFGIGFYSDGRFIANGYDYENRYNENESLNTWETASTVGYYRIHDNKLSIEYLIPSDFGTYEERKGEVKGDSIIIYENYFGIKKREIIYVLSDMDFK